MEEENNMKKVEALDICYTNDNARRCSVFAGVCKSREAF